MTRVLVTDGQERASLAIVRSLGSAGWKVYVCSTDAKSIAGSSRFAQAHASVPDPLHTPRSFVAAVSDLLGRWRIDVLVPVSEASLLPILAMRERFERVVIPFPSLERFSAISDKSKVLEIAADVGIAVPQQRILHSPGDLEHVASSMPFPLVLKPARSISESSGRRAKWTVSHASGQGELRARLSQYTPDAYPILLQQRIVGPGVGIFVLMKDGEATAVFAHRRLREKPPSGGVSVYRESIHADPKLVERAVSLLRRFDWTGVAMVEFKIDESTGTPYIMEVNGRFWGSLQLAIDAGVDFPLLLLKQAKGERLTPGPYRTGVRSRWWWGDVDHLMARIRKSNAALNISDSAPSRLRAFVEFMSIDRRDRGEVFRFTDPRPFVRETIDWFRHL